MSGNFGELRSALHGEPSAEAWARLCEAVDGWDGDEFADEARAYVLERLEDWPDDLRVAPAAWCALASEGSFEPKLELACMFPEVALDDDVLGRWLDAPVMKNVHTLDLKGIEDHGLIERLAQGSELRNVKKIDLENTSIGLEVFRALVESEHLTQMEWFNVGWTGLSSDEAGVYMGRAPWRDLEYLHIEGNGIYEEGGVALVTSPHLVSLRRLRLGWNDIGDATCKALANRAIFTEQLVELGVENNSIHDEGGVALCRSPRLARLVEFDLYNNAFTVKVARAVAENPALSKVVKFDLNENVIGDEGRALLRDSPYLTDELKSKIDSFGDDTDKLAYYEDD
jgi:hypothetical protein